MGYLDLSRRNALRLAGAAGIVTVFPGRHSFAGTDQTLTLNVARTRITADGVTSNAIAVNGSVPGPILRWREGQEVAIQVTNRLDEPTSIHWHGLLLQGVMDGSPGFNAFAAIAPGQTYTYHFKLRQSGTYWYHSHSAGQEQLGLYGAIVIDPAQPDPVRFDRDYVLFLSDHSAESPAQIMRKLKTFDGYYNKSRRTLLDFFRDADRDGLGAALQDRLEWGEMRMDPTDLADVTGYQFLVNGKGPADNWTALFQPGERVRLRIINGSSMSIFDVAIPGLPMIVVAADGQNIVPVKVDEFRIAVGETYDVLVMPPDAKPYTLMAEPIDRSGYARATLAVAPGMEGAIPPLRPRTLLTMEDMGMDHAAMGHGGGGTVDHSQMDHSKMGHGGMDHGASAPAQPSRPMGWADASTPPGTKALAYADLQSLAKPQDTRPPAQEIEVQLNGMMARYIWTLNGKKFDEGDPIRVRYGERVRIRFVNTTMMAHPMHLHGMFMELENGQTERLPKKHVVLVPPGKTQTVLLTADEVGEWPFHCHLLFHMDSGMMTRFIVEPKTASL